MARARITRSLVAILAGTIAIPAGSLGIAGLLDQAHAVNYTITCSGGGSFTITTTTIASGAGSGCKGIATVPEGITNIDGAAFTTGGAGANANPDITQLLLPSTLTSINDYGLQKLTGLTSLVIPSGVTNIGVRSLLGLSTLTSLTIAGGTAALPTKTGYTTIDGINAGRATPIAPQRLILGSGYTYLRQDAVQGDGYTELVFGSGTYYVGTGSFNNSNYLQAIDFGTSTSPQITLATQNVTLAANNPYNFNETNPNSFQGAKIRSIRNCDSNASSAFNLRLKAITNDLGATLYSLSTCNNTTPVITNATPASASGGSPPASITITGTNFVGLVGIRGVMFGSTPAASYTVNSATSITAVPPASLTSAEYSLTVNTFAGTSNQTMTPDATLSSLALSTGTLSPTFASATTSYTTSVLSSTGSITVTPTRTQAGATITVNGTTVTSGSASGAIALNVGSNTVTIVVTAQDGTTTKTYTVTVTRPSSDATLSSLALSTGTLSPTFASATTSYSASVGNVITSLTVTPTRTQANATITVNGTAVTSGSASGAISLNVGSNTVTIVVTAQDGATTSTYTITVTRFSNDATLSAIVLSAGTLSPTFASATTSYTASVGSLNSTITVTPTRTQTNATITVNGTAVTSGSASGVIALSVGSNSITVVATAQDGVTTKTYTITVTRPGTSDASLSLDPGVLIYRQSKELRATVSVAGKVTFYANSKVIPGCIKKVVSAGATVTCLYLPSIRGSLTIKATLVPTDSLYIGTSASSNLVVAGRTGRRGG